MFLVTLLFIVLTCAQLNEGVTIKPVEGCSHSDTTQVAPCASILYGHISGLLRCNVECSVLTSLIQCVNRAKVSATCAAAAVTAVDRLFSTYGSTCTYERLKTSCPNLPEIIPAGAATPLTEKQTKSMTTTTSMQVEGCSHSDTTQVASCALILYGHIDRLLLCNVECSVLTSLIQCVNRLKVSATCAAAAATAADRLFSTYGINCTYERLLTSCPDLPEIIPAGATTLLTEKQTNPMTMPTSMPGLRCSVDDMKHVTPCLTADTTYLRDVRTKCTMDCKLFGEVVRCVNEVGLSKICQENFEEVLDDLLRKFGPKNCTFQRIVKLCPKAPKVGEKPVKPGNGGRGNEMSGEAGGGAVGAVNKQGTLAVIMAAFHVIQLILPGRLLV